jgi:hypothetical protein
MIGAELENSRGKAKKGGGLKTLGCHQTGKNL